MEGVEEREVLLNLILSNPSSTDIILQVQSSDDTATGINN